MVVQVLGGIVNNLVCLGVIWEGLRIGQLSSLAFIPLLATIVLPLVFITPIAAVLLTPSVGKRTIEEQKEQRDGGD